MSRQEIERMAKRPDVFILLDDLNRRLQSLVDLTENMSQKMDKLGAFITFMGPMTRMFKKEQQYQYATIAAGLSGRVYYIKNPEPGNTVGIITQVGNSWFANTYLDWFIDHDSRPVQHVIANINSPKEYDRGIPFFDEVEWVAYNNAGVAHVFEVLCTGFFMNQTMYNKIVGK